MIKKIALALLAALVVIQFFQIDTTNPQTDPSNDFLAKMKPEPEVANLIRSACYDCHSNETQYPFYAKINPIGWILKDHVNEGREELNFSNWTSYTLKRMDHKLEECVELIDSGEMPMESYTWIHGEAKLTNEQRAKLAAYFSSLR
ncbi:MAG TPA: heme-binding domain-containing protein [Luteibaculaceae bacterium]|nr:heme-binding domain-containing protein [Luteibaculaceae bacterium]